MIRRTALMAAVAASALGCTSTPSAPPTGPMSFFVTSVGPGKGGDLGGLDGADRHCQALAQAAGAGNRTWRAYLSTQGTSFQDRNVVNARDRIGPGPWFNAKGVLIARDVDELHSNNNNISKETALTEKGAVVTGSGDKPTRHDILTGSRPDGTAFPPRPMPDMTCSSWTNGAKEGSAMTGHHDRRGLTPDAWALSWNSSHPSAGCDQPSLRSTGGDGLLYCFAEK